MYFFMVIVLCFGQGNQFCRLIVRLIINASFILTVLFYYLDLSRLNDSNSSDNTASLLNSTNSSAASFHTTKSMSPRWLSEGNSSTTNSVTTSGIQRSHESSIITNFDSMSCNPSIPMTEDSGIDGCRGSTDQPIASQHSSVQQTQSMPFSDRNSFSIGTGAHSLTSSDCSLQLNFGELMITNDGKFFSFTHWCYEFILSVKSQQFLYYSFLLIYKK